MLSPSGMEVHQRDGDGGKEGDGDGEDSNDGHGHEETTTTTTALNKTITKWQRVKTSTCI